MRTTKHKIKAVWMQDAECDSADVEVEITFTFLKGAPEQGPSYASGGQPADPDEIEFVSAKAVLGLAGSPYPLLAQNALDHWARDWLQEDGFAEALEVATSDYAAAREYAAELRADR